ncbi:MAG TPA: ATPase [Promicromonospora sp.]|nr:ATPase [Promicromonospora sp.]
MSLIASDLPRILGELRRDGTAVVTAPNGRTVHVDGTGNLDVTRQHVMQALTSLTVEAGLSEALAELDDPEVVGKTYLHVTTAADGQVRAELVSPPVPVPAPATPTVAAAPVHAAAPTDPAHNPGWRPRPEQEVPAGQPADAVAAAPRDPFERSFLTPSRSIERRPAQTGWRGAANKLGLRLAPTEGELSLRRAVRTVSQHWPGVRRVAVANGKGSAGKSPTAIMLSAVYARYGAGGVALIDNNPTRGTVGWRTEQGPHDATVLDLLPQIDTLMQASASHADLAGYLHHQPEDRFDVLRSKPDKLGAPFTADELDAVVQVLTRFYRLQVFDSGNDESASVWQRMIDLSTSLVVPTLARREWAETGRVMLNELRHRDEHGAALVSNAVVIVTNADAHKSADDVRAIADQFAGLVRGVATIPFDAGMVEGHLRWEGLQPRTRDAWVRAAALVADGF